MFLEDREILRVRLVSFPVVGHVLSDAFVGKRYIGYMAIVSHLECDITNVQMIKDRPPRLTVTTPWSLIL